MKPLIIAIVLLATPAFAQDEATIAAVKLACFTVQQRVTGVEWSDAQATMKKIMDRVADESGMSIENRFVLQDLGATLVSQVYDADASDIADLYRRCFK